MRSIELLSVPPLGRSSAAAGLVRFSVSLAGFVSLVERSFVRLETLSIAKVAGSATPWSCEDPSSSSPGKRDF